MHRAIRIALVLACLAFTTRASHAAGGFNLSWDDCGTFGSSSKNFACNSNIGAQSLYGSVVAPAPVPQFIAMSAVIDLESNQATMPPWWGFDTNTGCRAGPPSALNSSFDFVAGPFSCTDPWNGAAGGGSNYQTDGLLGPNFARLKVVAAVVGSLSLDHTSEYYMFRITISNAKTVGSGACAGCDAGVCLVLTAVTLSQPVGVGDFNIYSAVNRGFVTWQNGDTVPRGCPFTTPARNTTWGAVKSLYR